MFTQALKDYGKAVVIGKPTFGKGTVTTTFKLSNGGSITLSTARYYTKSGYTIEGNGITPDYDVDLTNKKSLLNTLYLNEDEQYLKAVEVLTN